MYDESLMSSTVLAELCGRKYLLKYLSSLDIPTKTKNSQPRIARQCGEFTVAISLKNVKANRGL